MRIVIVSDTHNQLDRINVPDGDMLIHCGDLTMGGTAEEIEKFNRHLGRLPHEHKIVIAGNHDFLLEGEPLASRYFLEGCTYLMDDHVTIDGIKIYGSPWQPEFHNWAFNIPRNSVRMQEVWSNIPADSDIVVTHGPPDGILDLTPRGERVGCELLRKRLDTIQPALNCFGHIHCARGHERIGDTLYINACNLNESYQPVHPPYVLDWHSRSKIEIISPEAE